METTRLILQGGGMVEPLRVEAETGSRLIDCVRDLARDGLLPLYWRCGQGTCGACLVRLEHAASAEARPLVLSGKERNVLARRGQLDEAQRSAPTLPDTPALPRLACHVVLPPGELRVSW
ncbi:2Fe-2S iron-sulfur cluster-binding protein [Chitinimonas lacunae]|uniref:2Fe-2S iron-sulfur cluster-binding protein n=1 Tax=Chitinimonas lacunae TaxID=1963018 RepID=A0ABV8MV96_9NEIS